MSNQIVVIAHNIRSTHNVGSLLRTCEGLGIQEVYFTGYTPFPKKDKDSRLPHIAEKLHKQIHKTALDAEDIIMWHQSDDITPVLHNLKKQGFTLAGLEQTPTSTKLPEFKPPQKLAIILGSEVSGMEQPLIDRMDLCLEIPMFGKKESFNVVEATTMALYHCTFR